MANDLKVFKKELKIKELQERLRKAKSKASFVKKYKAFSKAKLDVVHSQSASKLVAYATRPMQEQKKVNILGR